MARFIGIVLALLLMSAEPVHAQDAEPNPHAALPVNEQPLQDALPPSLRAVLDDPHQKTDDRTVRAFDKKFLTLSAALVAAMAADTHSTFVSRQWCPSCREDNPYAAPFIRRGPEISYTAGALFDMAVMGAAAAMRKSDNPALRKIWWVAPVALIVGHVRAIQHNYDLRHVCRDNPKCGRAP